MAKGRSDSARPNPHKGSTAVLDSPGSFKIDGLLGLFGAFAEQHLLAKGWQEFETIIGYAAPYALYVHEITRYYHKPPTKAKWLTDGLANPAIREKFMTFLLSVVNRVRDYSPKRAMYFAAISIIRQINLTVPISNEPTRGFLRDSYFVRNVSK